MDTRGDRTDAQLLATSGADPEAFACFYDRYEGPIVSYFMRRTRDAEVTADLTAEVFAAALGAAGRYRPQGPTAAAWLFTIAARTLAKSTRRRRVERRARVRVGMREVWLEEDSLQRIANAGEAERVAALLQSLPADQREAVRARIVEERSYPEIARALRTSELVVRKRVSRGLATLRREMEGTG